jgi:hypothetical protein
MQKQLPSVRSAHTREIRLTALRGKKAEARQLSLEFGNYTHFESG